MKGVTGLRPSSRRISGQSQTLPNDLLIEIFAQLPVRSLARLRYLSKYWYDVMKTPCFINYHRLRRGKNGRMLLIRRCLLPPEQDDVLSFHDLDNPEREVQPNFSISFINGLLTRKWGGSLHILGACTGIVCIMRDGCVTLCNPALREFKLLPPPPLPFDGLEGYLEILVGTGFGISCSGEFKVILMRTYVLNSRNLNHLYTSSTDSWKLIDDSPAAGAYPFFPIRELFFRGACHWPATTYDDHFPLVILYFNINTEVFGQLELPDVLSIEIDDIISPMVFNERLSVVLHGRNRQEAIRIWVMGEYGVKETWTFQFLIHPQMFLSPLLVWKNDESLLVEEASGRGQLSSISFLTNETIRYDIYGVKKNTRALIYEETLVRLNQGKTLEEMVSLAKTADSSLPNYL